MVVGSLFAELSIILAVALIIALIVKLLKQPLIIGYILGGIAVSPYFLDLVKSEESISLFAQMGIAVLLFMVGLNLNPRVIKEVGKVALFVGFGQIALTFGIGFLIGWSFGLGVVAAVYIGLGLAFSSTIIIIKLLSDKEATFTLYGKITIGILIVQDFVAVIALMVVSSIGRKGADLTSIALQQFGSGATLILSLMFVAYHILPAVTKIIARSQELLLLFSIGWAFTIASLFEYAGFSIEIGALLAGISLSISPYKYEISSKMKPLRDFFLLIFFILLGSQMAFSNVGRYILPIVLASLVVVIGKPLVIMVLMGRMGYTKRNSFLTGVMLSQISEFSFILLALGVSVGHIGPEILSFITIVGLSSIACSTYTIRYVNKLYRIFWKYLKIFERRGRKIDEGKYHQDNENFDLILFGYNRIGYGLKESFKKIKKSFLIVDNNPDTILKLAGRGVNCRYGDAEDSELIDDLPLKKAKMLISTIPDLETNLLLLDRIKCVNKGAIFIAVSHSVDETLELYGAGATYVIMPHFLGGTYTSHLLNKHGFNKKAFSDEGVKAMKNLIERKKDGQKDIEHERD